MTAVVRVAARPAGGRIRVSEFLHEFPQPGDVLRLVVSQARGRGLEAGFGRIVAVSPDRQFMTVDGVLPGVADGDEVFQDFMAPAAFEDPARFLAAAGGQVWTSLAEPGALERAHLTAAARADLEMDR